MTNAEIAHERMAAAFAEWQRRYREDPGQFLKDFEEAALGLDDYGERCAAYFTALLLEIP